MTMRMLVLAFAASLVVPAAAAAQAVDISGRWDVSITSPQGPMPPSVLELKKEGDGFVGVFNTAQGVADVSASVKEKAVTFVLPPYQTPQGPVDLVMTGTVEGDSMQGTINAGNQMTLDWSARRTAPATPDKDKEKPSAQEAKPADLTGTWGLEVTTAAGTGTPTVVLKQEGEKLSGQYSGQLGESAVTGTVKGNEFTFSFSVTIEGNNGTVIYTGTHDNGTMKGTVSLAGMGDGTFTGKKK